MTISSQLKLTPAQKRFLEKFDKYTGGGTVPQEYQDLREAWKIQHRTMNKCQRSGLLVCKGVSSESGKPVFIVNPEKREFLGLTTKLWMTRRLRPRKRLTRVL